MNLAQAQAQVSTDKLLLSLNNLSLAYSGKPVFQAQSLDLERLCIYAVVGKTGCGKTSLLHLMAGLIPATTGTIKFSHADDQRRVALIPQDYGLFPWKTVRANARMGLEIKRSHGRLSGRAEDKSRVDQLLEQLGITELAERWPATLSGGQKQRTAIARALATDPALLLMDEPFSALDADIRENLQDLVRSLPERYGTTPIFVTHDLHEAIRISDRIIVFENLEPERTYSIRCIHNKKEQREELRELLRDNLRSSRTGEEL